MNSKNYLMKFILKIWILVGYKIIRDNIYKSLINIFIDFDYFLVYFSFFKKDILAC